MQQQHQAGKTRPMQVIREIAIFIATLAIALSASPTTQAQAASHGNAAHGVEQVSEADSSADIAAAAESRVAEKPTGNGDGLSFPGVGDDRPFRLVISDSGPRAPPRMPPI